MSWREKAKRAAALEAVKHVKNGFIVGLGSGNTAAYAIREIAKRIQQENLRVFGVPTSHQAFMLAVECGLPVTTLNEHSKLDLTIDGADEVDEELNLIKGLGGALVREKIVASASKKVVIVVDETKVVQKLGMNHPVPVEVLPFALSPVMLKMKDLGGEPALRTGNGKVGPVVTDNGNFIVDVKFRTIEDAEGLDAKLKRIPGVVETGLFVGTTDIVYVGGKTGIKKREKKRSNDS
ncbi:MAG: ribose-5-phosphate isomerase RpiA [Thermoproteota archaeon]|nr:ribose-5-phosphate isomerase RpiA [Thermoproteota archaeon]